jgi:Zn-dependent peptidase ImmA (M78 family)/DNA-binding XRE family transcriptional regulator
MSMMHLAELIGVQPRSISGFEKGEFCPSDETLISLAKSLRFPVEFFFGPDVDIPQTRSVSFRALSRMTAGQRDAALGAGAIALMLNDWIENHFELPTCELPDMGGEEPEAAAEAVRSEWLLGYRPIKNIIHLLESKGVRVFSLAEDTRQLDAYSFWRSETPFVFLNTKKSSERTRFDAAHELGHLILHKHGGPVGQEAELQANAFASAFLMPASSVLAIVRRTPTAKQLIKLKKHWTISVAALAYRLWKLRILSDWQYRSMCAEIAPYRKEEPESAPRETSQIMPKIFAALDAEGMSKNDVARQLSIHRSQLEEIIFGLAVAEGSSSGIRSSKRGSLRVVK